jgi:AraC-like DNA-binding protein
MLSDVLQTFRLREGRGYNAILSAPWGIEFPIYDEGSPLYVVSRGACQLELRGSGVQLYLNSGDVVMLSRGDPHVLRDGPGSRVVPFSSLSFAPDEREDRKTLRYGAGGPETVLLAGEFMFDSQFAQPLLRAMDRVIHIRADSDEDTSNFSAILKMLCREGRSSEPGWRAASSELMKLLFIQILRFNMAEHQRDDRTCQGNHPFALMFDGKLRGVAEALHHNPERPWTVADMAAEAGMSRTSFSLRFAQVAGVAPLAYLTNHRMMKAAELLEGTDATLEKIAERIGYGSEAAFSTAFKREMGMAPGGYRRTRNKSRPGGTSVPGTNDPPRRS